jgi:hypothetical protein
MKKPKRKKPPSPTLAIQPSWNLGRVAKITISTTPTPKFLDQMVVKSQRAKGA